MSNKLRELVQVNGALENIAHTLDIFGHNDVLVDQMMKLITERDHLMSQIKVLN